VTVSPPQLTLSLLPYATSKYRTDGGTAGAVGVHARIGGCVVVRNYSSSNIVFHCVELNLFFPFTMLSYSDFTEFNFILKFSAVECFMSSSCNIQANCSLLKDGSTVTTHQQGSKFS
jgi:hypothetical protein